MRVLGTFAIFGFFAQHAFANLLWSQVLPSRLRGSSPASTSSARRKLRNVQTVLTWLKVLMILVIAGFCFTNVEHGSWHNFEPSSPAQAEASPASWSH